MAPPARLPITPPPPTHRPTTVTCSGERVACPIAVAPPRRIECALQTAPSMGFRPRAATAAARCVAFRATLAPGDTVRVEMKDKEGHSIFGAIEQTVVEA